MTLMLELVRKFLYCLPLHVSGDENCLQSLKVQETSAVEPVLNGHAPGNLEMTA